MRVLVIAAVLLAAATTAGAQPGATVPPATPSRAGAGFFRAGFGLGVLGMHNLDRDDSASTNFSFDRATSAGVDLTLAVGFSTTERLALYAEGSAVKTSGSMSGAPLDSPSIDLYGLGLGAAYFATPRGYGFASGGVLLAHFYEHPAGYEPTDYRSGVSPVLSLGIGRAAATRLGFGFHARLLLGVVRADGAYEAYVAPTVGLCGGVTLMFR